MCCSYNPNKSNISRHLDTLGKSLDLYSAHYENTILIDFNISINDTHTESFCESYRFKSLIPQEYVQNSCVTETGPSDS